ncbi:MAG: deoxyribose-phosphate aldolase [Ilumatobacter sp.]|uniref:deoxyribose-phosphate aldolase n=1 Tax=Ilumatobacter sp. TaxID=1967498 RepID=UPI003C7728D6
MTFDDAHPDVATIERIISLIDLTDLDDDHRPDGIDGLLADAARHRTAAVCVWPEFVSRASRELSGSGVRVATVANFPTGAGSAVEVAEQVGDSLAAGADDIDVVLPWRSFLDGDVEHAVAVLDATAAVVRESPGALLKVILETGDHPTSSSIADASRLAIASGADFLKTSTGKSGTGATPEAVATMLDVIAEDGGRVGIKPSGGVRTVSDATALLDLAGERLGEAWATPQRFRFGASGLLADALSRLGRG